MEWILWYSVSVAFLAASIIISVLLSNTSKTKRVINKSGNIFFAGVFISLVALFEPIFYEYFTGQAFAACKAVLLSIHTTLRVFVLDSDFDIIQDSIENLAPWIQTHYSITASVLFVIAPLLTFGFILSFFKNVAAYRRYIFGYFKDAYIFSELNEKSLTLAESIIKTKKNALIVYTDVFENNEEQSFEQIEQARKIGAVCFKKDLLSINLKTHGGAISFFIIGDNEEENINQSLKLIEAYRLAKNTHLYLFSTRIESELLMAQTNKGGMKVRRINDVRSLINRTLYDSGSSLFENAVETNASEKLISAVVVGMGQHGTEMVKALTWFCQMDGYRIQIDAFDRDENAESIFTALCPELMSDKYNGVYIDGEAQYKINIHSGYEVNTKEFAEAIQNLEHPTYVFVALGNDADNIKAVVNLRMLFEQIHVKPTIQAVVYSTIEKEALDGVKNYRGQSYEIDFIGDIKTSYSEKVIIDSELEEDALLRHLKWGKEEEFWSYEYNYRSSMASAIHMKAREACRVAGAGKKEEELTDEEKAVIEPLEHRRWNAYMRSEGYIYSGSPEKASRNDLAKMHHDLVCFDDLTEEEKRKDRRVGNK